MPRKKPTAELRTPHQMTELPASTEDRRAQREAVRKATQEAGYGSARPDPAAAPPEPAPSGKPRDGRGRRRRIRKSIQLNMKVTEETYERFLDIRDDGEFDNMEEALIALMDAFQGRPKSGSTA